MCPPRFSIVIPTRNRPTLLGYAIRSALAQTGDDFEVVVSDNSTDHQTRNAVQQLRHPRLRYTMPPSPLARMSDSWEFAVQQARGRHVTFLCDDDALSPCLLDRLRTVLEGPEQPDLITWEGAGYFHVNWIEADKQNSLWLQRYTRQCQTIRSRESLHHVFDQLWPGLPVPKMLQSLCSRKVIEDVMTAAGRFFIPTCPDLSTAVFTLAVRDSYVHIDEPLMLNWKRFYRDHDGARTYACLPLNSYIGINACAQTLMDAKRLMPVHLRDHEVNWARYFSCYADSLRHLASSGVDVGTEKGEFERVLADQPAALRREVSALQARGRPSKLRQALRSTINIVPGLSRLERLLRPAVRRVAPIRIDGRKAGFRDIYECAQKLPHLLRA
jgi:glycosyltransferase involved in cell wall biosynthesis